MISFPSIGQFNQAIRALKERVTYSGKSSDGTPTYDRVTDFPVLDFVGTVKIHGTNASIVFDPTGSVTFQSRSRVITPEDDNMGFARFCVEDLGDELLKKMERSIRRNWGLDGTFVVYGEWCGGSVQKGSSMQKVPEKMFIVFGVAEYLGQGTGGESLLSFISPDEMTEMGRLSDRVRCIYEFPTYKISVDVGDPKKVQNDLVKMTTDVETECPVALSLGVSGTGEGIVWRSTHPDFQDSKFWFKVKGEKHSVTKVKTLAEVDLELMKSLSDFSRAVLTDSRLEQGVEFLKEMKKPTDQRGTGDFIKWVTSDVLKEESERIEASGLDKSAVMKSVSSSAREWFLKRDCFD